MGIRSVLVVGAGIAGSTVAYLLGRSGLAVSVVERSGEQRSSGNPVDVRGPALPVIEQMNLLAPIRAAATQTTRLAAVDSSGQTIGWIPTQTGRDSIEIPRNELAAILASAGSQHAEFLYDDSVTAMRQDDDGVEVGFDRAAPRRFDLVVGADGLHSTVRRLVFGPEEQFTEHLGLYVATIALDRATSDPHTVLIHNVPGRAVALHPTNGSEGGAFFFRHSLLPADVRSDLGKKKQLLAAEYDGLGWRVPELLDRVWNSGDDLYFDSVARVRLGRWSHGRVVVIGDAADCVSLLGEGSSMAIAGAAVLAQHLAGQPTDIPVALRNYEQVQRKRLKPHHRGASIVGHLLVPRTRSGIAVRDALFRTWATGAAAHQRVRSRAATK